MAHIYTKTGDKGDTTLFGGKRLRKDHSRVAAYGAIDELVSILGVVCSFTPSRKTKTWLDAVQNDLFIVQAELAGAPKKLTNERTKRVEKRIDEFEKKLTPLHHFILPGGTHAGALLHYARTVCRRAEREVVGLSQKETVDAEIIRYLNRLSDFLFMAARWENRRLREVKPQY